MQRQQGRIVEQTLHRTVIRDHIALHEKALAIGQQAQRRILPGLFLPVQSGTVAHGTDVARLHGRGQTVQRGRKGVVVDMALAQPTADTAWRQALCVRQPGGRQSGDFVIGQPDDAHPGPAYRPDEIGAYAAPGQRAALLRRQIGGQHRQGLGLQETGQFAASFVELMIAQGHGVVGQQRVRSGDHGPFVDAVEQGALELVARVQGDDVVLLLSGSLDGCADASQTAAAVRGLETGVHVLIDTGKKGMGIIHVQEAQLQTCIRGCLAVRGSAGNHEEEKSTEEGR